MANDNQKRILLADDDLSYAQTLSKTLSREGFEVITVVSGDEAYNKVMRQQIDLMIMEAGLPGMDGYTLCRRLRQNPALGSLPILMLTSEGDINNKIAGFEAGVDDFLVKPFEQTELIYRAKGLMKRSNGNGHTLPTVHTEKRKGGQVIAVFSTKGGVGKTLVAANLAVALRKRSGKRVALFDADLYFGDIGVHLNMPGMRGVLDLVEKIEHLKPEQADSLLSVHDSGVRVLLSPFYPEDAELITAEHIKRILEFLQQAYDYIVVDCHSSYDDRMLMVLEHADDIRLVVTPEIGTVKNTVLFLELSAKLGLSKDKVHIVLNRSKSVGGIDTSEVQKALRHPVAVQLVSGGRSVVASVNRGTPLVMKQPEHPIAQQILRMTEFIIANPVVAANHH